MQRSMETYAMKKQYVMQILGVKNYAFFNELKQIYTFIQTAVQFFNEYPSPKVSDIIKCICCLSSNFLLYAY